MSQKKTNQRWRSRPSPSLVEETEHAKQDKHEEHCFRENPYLHVETPSPLDDYDEFVRRRFLARSFALARFSRASSFSNAALGTVSTVFERAAQSFASRIAGNGWGR